MKRKSNKSAIKPDFSEMDKIHSKEQIEKIKQLCDSHGIEYLTERQKNERYCSTKTELARRMGITRNQLYYIEEKYRDDPDLPTNQRQDMLWPVKGESETLFLVLTPEVQDEFEAYFDATEPR